MFAPGGQLLLYKMFEDNDLISYRSIGKEGKLGEWIPFSGNGKIVSYFSNGNLAIEENYANGKYDKARRIFYPNGNVYSLLNYTHNLIQGEGFIYYPNGKIKEKLNYKDDAASGNWEYYEPNGMIQRREPYVLGVLDGKVEFFSHGNKTKEQKFWGGAPID